MMKYIRATLTSNVGDFYALAFTADASLPADDVLRLAGSSASQPVNPFADEVVVRQRHESAEVVRGPG